MLPLNFELYMLRVDLFDKKLIFVDGIPSVCCKFAKYYFSGVDYC